MTGETRRGSAASSPGYDEASIASCSGFPTGAPGPWKMANPVREYDWGSTGALAALQGREPSGRPDAELWMGAHSTAPSRLRQPDGSEVSLAAAIHANPVAVLGRECTTRFGARLPFLLKVLAVGRALSIQVHPSQAQAAEGSHANKQPAYRRPSAATWTRTPSRKCSYQLPSLPHWPACAHGPRLSRC